MRLIICLHHPSNSPSRSHLTRARSGEARSARALLVVFWARRNIHRALGPQPRCPRPERSVLVCIKHTLIRFLRCIGILLNCLGFVHGCRVQRAVHASRCSPDQSSCGRIEARLVPASSTSPVGHSHLSIPFAKRLEALQNNSKGQIQER